ncbi:MULTISPECIES: hypothetical protein [Methylobacterium]|uniref:Recombination-associated protein RdgC n=2 Tax=Pseudomonadota TaxID=1224 RepID=A0ABQ4SXD8_9HYPH|nr:MULTISPECIES: hypothetical protein [Methylobacterium]PIU08175.1 MAG: hypothetical protein COT56_02305 [Methylobacterium sp. CG09_land_8_20_14_0_10_71_15]PIU15685.1 MAG: hypothetical protein COT28_03555 [Methylobacterium sp. CG08_land_8_20_14_0_20_71_15]GBU17257.1 hypothetical protein AwMethylo_14720 [Methylobacterium sp.]GJE07832.1 hypothetical protein AOPFMNJM_3164 [Methylobacterium jeotgali]
MSATFAKGTKVPAESTRLEIEKLVGDRGAEAFAFALEGDRAKIAFRLQGRALRFNLPLPTLEEERFQRVQRGLHSHARTPTAARNAWMQATREAWRALLLCIKAKFTAIEGGIVTFDEEFLAHVVMPDGRTVGEIAREQLALTYKAGEQPPLLLDYTKGAR